MGSKGQLVIRYAGDVRDLQKKNKQAVGDVKDFGKKAGTAASAAGRSAGKGFGDKFAPAAKSAGKAGSKDFGAALGATESGAKNAGKLAGVGFMDRFTSRAKGAGKKGASEFGAGLRSVEGDARAAGRAAGQGFEDRATSGLKSAGKAGASEFGSGIKLTISKAEAAGKGAGRGFRDRFTSQAEGAGKEGAEGFSSSLKVGAVAGAAVAGAAVAVALTDGMEREKLGDKVAASLNLTGKQAKKAGDVASKLYAGAWGENMPEVFDAVESVMSSIDGMANASPKMLHRVSAGVLDIAGAFDIEATNAARDLGILIKTGLAKDAVQGLDLITATLQKVPAAMRGDVSDAIEEYSQFFADLGFDGTKSMELLVAATEGGKYGIDKMGDAVKEFSIRSSDGSKLTNWAFTQIGLDADSMSNKFLKGGDTAKEAFDKTVRGLLGIKDPSVRAQAAIGLFGTPIEDLGVKKIPKFLESLLSAEGGLGKVEGRSKKMGDTLNDNVSTKFTAAKRAAQNFLTEGLVALYEGFDTGKAKGDGFAGALSNAGAALKPVADAVQAIVETPWFSKLAGKLIAIGGAVAGLSMAYKFSGIKWLINTGFPGLSTKASSALGPIGLVLAGIIALDEWQASKEPDYKSVMDMFVDFPKDPWSTIKTSLKQNMPRLTAFIPGTAGVQQMMGPVFSIWRGVGRVAKNVSKEARSAASGVGIAFTDLKDRAVRKFRDLGSSTSKVWGNIRSSISDKARAASESARRTFGDLKEKASKRFRDFKESASKIWSGVRSSISDKARAASESARRTFGDLKEKASSKFRSFKESAGKIWSGIRSSISDKARRASESARRTFGDLKDKATDKFRGLKDGASKIWSRIKDGVSDKARKLSENVRSAFGMMKDIAGKKFREFWNGLKTAAAKPVRFVVNTVWNNGLRKMLNAIPGVEIKPTKLGFRRGGPVFGAGTETSDSIDARLSRNEHVWTAAEVKAAGGHNKVEQLRRAALSGNFKHSDPGFAEGGGVTPEAIARAQKFARSQMGKPYGWGAVGPSAYDCSGFMSALTNVLRGRTPYSRVGSTASFPWSGFERGPGQFTIGSSPNFSGGIGHMAGNLGGLGVESRGGTGVIVGGGAMSLGRFQQVYHLGKGGDFGGNGGGNWWDDLSTITSTMKKLPGQIRDMMSMDSWMSPFLKKMARAVAEDVAGFINKKIPDVGPIKTNPVRVPTFDRGGTLSPGYNTVYNGLGRPEELRRVDDGGSAKSVVYVPREGELGRMLLQILRKEIRAAGGDPVIVLGRR